MLHLVRKKMMGFLIAMVTLGFSITSVAGLMPPDDLAIDFRTADWAPAHGQQTYELHGVHIAAYPDYFEVEKCIWIWCYDKPVDAAVLTQDDTDGLGNLHSVGGFAGQLDNRKYEESIVVSFTEPWKLGAVWLAKLFPNEVIEVKCKTRNRWGRCIEKSYTGLDEIGGYQVDGAWPAKFNGEYSSGFLKVELGDIMPDEIVFFVPPNEKESHFSDYSIVGFEAMKGDDGASVPAPATLALFGLGLLLLASRRAKTQKGS